MQSLPISILTDSYKAAHFAQYPPNCTRMVAYGEFRQAYDKDINDARFVFYGLRYVVENYVARQWTVSDVECADQFFQTHNVGFTPAVFPKELFLSFIAEHDGHFPVRIEALPEGTVANVRVPIFQIFAEHKYTPLVTFLETLLTHLWYPSTVATLSRRCRDVIEQSFQRTVDNDNDSAAYTALLESRLHDFGMRGCTCVEQTVIGGCAHLLSFRGSDTLSACYYAQMHLNSGRPVAASIPATEHSVMTSWPSEADAIRNMIARFGGPERAFSIVMDSYDYDRALRVVLPSVAPEHVARGGTFVVRPDSGDPVQCIVDALEAGERTFGAVVNRKGFKVLNRMAALQGDGIQYATIGKILAACEARGYSAANVAFGMGGGLLQRVNRDTMSFATKLSYVEEEQAQGGRVQGRWVMKRPKTDSGKTSYPGIVSVRRHRDDGQLYVYPRDAKEPRDDDGDDDDGASASAPVMRTVYDHGRVCAWDDFDTVRARVQREWHACKPAYDPISPAMKARIAECIKLQEEREAKMGL